MIDYSPFWKTLEDSKENWYTLTKHHHVSDTPHHRQKHTHDNSTKTGPVVCMILIFYIENIAPSGASEEVVLL